MCRDLNCWRTSLSWDRENTLIVMEENYPNPFEADHRVVSACFWHPIMLQVAPNTSSKEYVLSNSAGFNHFFWLGDGKSPIARNQIVSPKHLIVSILSPSWQVFSQFHPRLFPYRHLRLCSYTTACKWHLNPFVMSPYWSFRQGVFVCSKPNCNVSIPASNFDLLCTCAAVAWLTNWTQIKE